MKHLYKINSFHNERGEAFTAVYCEDLNELAIESGGGVICAEQDSIEDVLAGTPWNSISEAALWPEMTDADYEQLSSAGLRNWIGAKE
jgi:hypothetical protein